jgi:agmatinase
MAGFVAGTATWGREAGMRQRGPDPIKILLGVFALVLTGTVVLGSSNAAGAADYQLPGELRDKLSGLDRSARTFVTSGEALAYLPARQLEHVLATRDAEGIETFVADLMAVAEQMGYDASRDMGAMPLNTTSRGYNRAMPRMILDGIDRDPGPFGVHRYLFPESGVPTFAGADVALYPEDLVAGEVDVAIVGIPNDMGSGRRNAEYGPRVMRAMNTLDEPDVATLVDPMEVLSVVDYGDFAIDNMSTERTVGHVTAMVAETAGTGAIPMMVGGDTSMLYPGVKGVAEVHGAGSFGLVHFSAHPDAHRTAAHTISDTQAVFMLLDEGIVDGEDLIQVGLRGKAVDVDTLTWLRGEGVRYHTMAEIGARGYDAVLERVLDEALAGPEQTFVSIDVSVIEPTEMVSAGRIASNGLRVQQAASAIRYLCAAKDIVGFEITDMSPMLDYSRLSAVNANTLLNACLVGVAARRAGYGPEDVHPLALDHGQD